MYHSITDVYPNSNRVLSTQEETAPELEEQLVVQLQPVPGHMGARQVVEPKAQSKNLLAVFVGAIIVLILLGIAGH